MIQLDAGDIIKMKKKHPCGSDEWQIVKTGADIKLRCCGCSHEIISVSYTHLTLPTIA